MPPELASRLRMNVEERLGLSRDVTSGSRALFDWRNIEGLQPQFAFAAAAPPPPPGPPPPPPGQPPPPPPRGQFRVARPDRPNRGFSGGGLWDGCKDSCMEGIVEAICDSICG